VRACIKGLFEIVFIDLISTFNTLKARLKKKKKSLVKNKLKVLLKVKRPKNYQHAFFAKT
jgi:hypothetical protein